MNYTIKEILDNKKRLNRLKNKFSRYSKIVTIVTLKDFFNVSKIALIYLTVVSLECYFLLTAGEKSIPISAFVFFIHVLFRTQNPIINKENSGIEHLSKKTMSNINLEENKMKKLIKNLNFNNILEEDFFLKYQNDFNILLINKINSSTFEEIINNEKLLSRYISNLRDKREQESVLKALTEKIDLIARTKTTFQDINVKKGNIINV